MLMEWLLLSMKEWVMMLLVEQWLAMMMGKRLLEC